MTFLEQIAPIAATLANLAGAAGLALSLYMFITSRRDRRPRLTVSVGDAEGEYETPSYDEDAWYPPEPFHIFYVDIANPGERRIKVVSLSIQRSKRRGPVDRSRRFISHDEFQSEKKPPFFLHPGDGLSFTADFDEFEDSVRQNSQAAFVARAVVHDAAGNTYRSSWHRFAAQESDAA